MATGHRHSRTRDRAVEETSKAGLQLYSREDLLATADALETLKKDVERALLRIGQLTSALN